MGFVVLIKRKGSKKFLGAIPAKKGATKNQIRRSVRRRLGSRFSFRIVTNTQLRMMLKRLVPKGTLKKIKRRRK